ncbi:MAG TPA: transporter substrate-binding domain-containing protein [Candidatus Binatia bacterium]|jgi:polar amino acid transport system substrate-binding protein|nr:transporter substrate-binding domain-containing protein [Candidatus Binatia bacterium]
MKTPTLILFLCLLASIALAQSKGQTLRVATRQVRPFVFEENGRLTGFSIELWQEIAKQINVQSEFLVKPTVKELLGSINAREAALGIAAISITAERELQWDFSQPMFDAGLQILVAAQGSHGGVFSALIDGLFSSAVLPIIGVVLLIILVPAHLVWFFERRNPTGMLAHRAYFPGIFEACWWAASTLATQADQMPRAALARIVAVIWMFASVVFIAYFTAAVTSSLTVQQLRGDINGPEDLPGKRVATVKDTTSAEYLRQHNAEVVEFPKVEEAYEALQQGQAEAVVYDTPVLLYYASHDGKGKVQTVGSIFRKENYGIAFPPNSPYRKPVNEALLKLKENGTYEKIYTKWFGGPAG